METITYDRIHEASIHFNKDERRVYRFELCNGKAFEFVLPVIGHECKGGE